MRRATCASGRARSSRSPQQGLGSVRSVSAFDRQDLEASRMDEASRATVTAALQARRVKSLLSPVVTIVVAFCTAFVLWRGTALILAGVMTVGALTVFLAYLSKFFKPVQDLAKMTNTIAQTAVGLERIQTILSADDVIPEKPDAIAPPPFKGEIAFEHVAFGYDKDNAGPARRQLHGQAGAGHRRRRRHRQRQVDDREPHSALLRSDRRARADRRRRRARLPAPSAAPADRLRAAGDGALPRHDPRQHRLRASGRRDGGGDRRRGEARQRRRIHRQDAAGLRHASSASAATRCRAASASASASRAR